MSGLSFETGEIIGGRYRLESKLGEGGMGAVWRGQHVTLKSPVAIKFINPGLATSQSALSRFMLEAQSSAALRSTHIVQVFDFGVENGVPYIAMELLPGESLADRLTRERTLSAAETARIMTEVARAMEYAHGAGIVHRDLKPDNIFLVQEGNTQITKVLDFGIAKVTGGGFDATTGGGTQTGAVLGTPFYVSPEQARGNKQVDHRSDLWALGVIAYECMMGAPPFVSDGLGDLIMKICSEPHPPPSSVGHVPRGFDAWVDHALQKDPEARFQAAVPMFEAFSAMLSQSSMEYAATVPPGPPTAAATTAGGTSTTGGFAAAASSPARQSGSRVAIALGTTAALLGLAGVAGWFAFSETTEPSAAVSASADAVGAAPTSLAAEAPLAAEASLAGEAPLAAKAEEAPAAPTLSAKEQEPPSSEPSAAEEPLAKPAAKPKPRPPPRPKPTQARKPTARTAAPAAPKPTPKAPSGASLFDDRK